ncbi:type IX secretion system PorP/SprF family membrane protein [Chitinophaga dinghuensis]|uniref:Type IX secretion system PorP/SprF family membrane protein n=1 Tax=Chitinophaga dinghuensis TaxID=1539050 RepID=A0A327WDD9_9BACT|nr:PorP/SprF family type IX secretion system membrane protein [Chitinophaga dinghuensis]RAJ87932.1 type IX secretion system PorP/SprF family membrane protein [Chitinophaga dinghuensis]
MMRFRMHTNKILARIGFTVALFYCSSQVARAQSFGNSNAVVDPLGIQYFLNPYMSNPSFAGLDSGLHVNLAYRKQWTDMPGSPQTKLVTADGFVGYRVGAGLQVYNDAAGLLSNTRVAATYAYHLPLGHNKQYLNFGISAVFYGKHLNTKEMNADPNDPSVGAYNRRDNYFESDFGVSYTNRHLTLQAGIPNVFSFAKNKPESRTYGTEQFILGAGYRFDAGEQITSVEPKAFYRNIYGGDGILDVGVKAGLLHNWADATAIYHSTGNFTLGAGFAYIPYLHIQFLYTTQTAGLQTYSNGSMELNLRVNLFQ